MDQADLTEISLKFTFLVSKNLRTPSFGVLLICFSWNKPANLNEPACQFAHSRAQAVNATKF